MSIIHEKFSFSQIQPIQEHSNEESFQLKAKKQSQSAISSDFSQFQKPQYGCEEMSPYLKPSLNQKWSENGQKPLKKKKKSNKSNKYKSTVSLYRGTSNKENKGHKEMNMKITHLNHHPIQEKKKFLKKIDARINNMITSSKNKSQTRQQNYKSSLLLNFQAKYPSKKGKVSENRFIKNRRSPQQSKRQKIPQFQTKIKTKGPQFKEKLITQHLKSDFSKQRKYCLSLPCRSDGRLTEFKKSDIVHSSKQSQPQNIFTKSRGGLAYSISVVQFVSKDRVSVRKPKQPSLQRKKTKNRISSKQEILRRRKLAFSYGQFARRRTFGYF